MLVKVGVAVGVLVKVGVAVGVLVVVIDGVGKIIGRKPSSILGGAGSLMPGTVLFSIHPPLTKKPFFLVNVKSKFKSTVA